MGKRVIKRRRWYHYFFKALDVSATEAVLGAWVRRSGEPGQDLGQVALDGKRLRGSAKAGHDGREGVHLVSAFASRLGGVVGQVQVAQVAPEANEITAALTLLEGLPLQGGVITGDAMFCQRTICQSIRDAQGDYLFAVKANQPELMADIALSFGDAFPPGTGQGTEGGRRAGAIGRHEQARP